MKNDRVESESGIAKHFTYPRLWISLGKRLICFYREGEAIPLNNFAMANALETNGRARLLPSLRRNGSAGASPSRRNARQVCFNLLIFLWLVLVRGNCVFAHGDGDISGGFASGISHPIRGMDHVVAMLAVGLWGAQLGAPAIWVLPIAFPLVMAFGAAMSLMGFPLPGVEIGIAFSAIVLGLMVLMESRPPLAISLSLVAAFALFHGHAHGGELPHGESGLAYSLGFVLGTGLLHAVGIGIGCLGHWSWGKNCLRAAGALVMVSGVYFLISSLGYVA